MKDFVLIATFTYPHEYSVLRHLLEEEQIPYNFQNETMVSISPFYSNALGGIKLFVHKDYEKEVQKMIDRLADSHLRIVE